MDIEFTSQASHGDDHTGLDNTHNMTKAFRRYGFIVIRQCFNVDFIERLNAILAPQTVAAEGLKKQQNTLLVGDKRFSQSVTLTPSLNIQNLYANPVIMPVVAALLGPRHMLSSVVQVLSLAGDTQQHLHRDHPPLFETAIDKLLPPHALKLYIPLTPCNLINGSTIFYPQSHNGDLDETNSYRPSLALGDVILFDYRLRHQGTANNSNHPRRMLFLSYSRQWFLDAVNFTSKARFEVDKRFYDAMPEENQYLLKWFFNNSSG